jgi:hypothetical protein
MVNVHGKRQADAYGSRCAKVRQHLASMVRE